MHRIDHQTRAVDLHGAGKDGFTGGDPVGGIAPTTLTPDWCNAVQEEIANAIALGAVPLVKGQNDQLAQVIAALTAPEPDEEPTVVPTVERTVYVPMMDFRTYLSPSSGAQANGWFLNGDVLMAQGASQRARYAVPIPSGASITRVEGAAFVPGVKLHLYRETYDPTGQAAATQGPRVTDTVEASGAWEVLSCLAIAAQNKATSRLIIEIEASAAGAFPVGYGAFRWVRYTMASYANVPD